MGLTDGTYTGGLCGSSYGQVALAVRKGTLGEVVGGTRSDSQGVFGDQLYMGLLQKSQLSPSNYHYTGLVAEFSPDMLQANLYLKY